MTEIHASAWHGQVAHQNQLNIEESLLTSRAMSDQRLREGSIAVNTQREQAQRQDLLRTFDHSSRSVGERATGLIDERAAGAMSGLSTPQFATPNADARAGAASRPLTQASLSTAILQNNHLQASLAAALTPGGAPIWAQADGIATLNSIRDLVQRQIGVLDQQVQQEQLSPRQDVRREPYAPPMRPVSANAFKQYSGILIPQYKPFPDGSQGLADWVATLSNQFRMSNIPV